MKALQWFLWTGMTLGFLVGFCVFISLASQEDAGFLRLLWAFGIVWTAKGLYECFFVEPLPWHDWEADDDEDDDDFEW